MPTDIARYSIELFKPGGEGAGIEEILDRHADLKIARSIYRTRVEEYPGRLTCFVTTLRCWPEAISRSHDSSGLLVTTISDGGRGDHRRDRRRGDGVFVARSAGSGRVGRRPHLGGARPQAASDSEHLGRGAATA